MNVITVWIMNISDAANAIIQKTLCTPSISARKLPKLNMFIILETNINKV